jgi:hypothetical protein
MGAIGRFPYCPSETISKSREPLVNIKLPFYILLCTQLTLFRSIYSIEFEISITENFVAALLSHNRSPRIHLLGEKGRTQVKVKMPFVRGLHTWVDATATTNTQGEISQTLALHELFSAYPNLEHLSVSVNRRYRGCVLGWWHSTRILPLTLSENETFPPLKAFSLSGYHIHGREISLWRERFPWDKLHSLSLGPQDNPGFLELATGRVNDLRTLKITSYGDSDSATKLDALLHSFNTLENLIAKGSVPSLAAVTHHTGLRHLCLHDIEQPDRKRRILNAEEIKDLDRHCPKIASLKIDLAPDGISVSRDVFMSLDSKTNLSV